MKIGDKVKVVKLLPKYQNSTFAPYVGKTGEFVAKTPQGFAVYFGSDEEKAYSKNIATFTEEELELVKDIHVPNKNKEPTS